MMPRRYPLTLGSVLALALACSDSGAGTDTATTTGVTGATAAPTTTTTTLAPTTTTTTTGEGASEASAAPTSTSTSGQPKLDVGSTPTTGTSAAGCDKVDFLFVIDNSGSMAAEQTNLITSFPGFIDTITNTLDAKDYHIMAVSTDNGMNTGINAMCQAGVCSCTPAPVCCQTACQWGDTCNGFACDDLPITACNFEYGTGKEYDANGVPCDLEGGRRYMLDSQPNIDQAFECVANVGTYGSGDEKPIHTAIAACSAAQNGPGGCDEGFLRDDAILVLTFITDEEDDNSGDNNGSPGDPQSWYEALVAAKNGDPEAVVVLGLLGDSNLPNGTCSPDNAEPAPRLQSFVGMFPSGVVGSVCAPDYTPFFQQAVSVIDVACDSFEPPA